MENKRRKEESGEGLTPLMTKALRASRWTNGAAAKALLNLQTVLPIGAIWDVAILPL